ncbi:MAG TPA: DUF1707 domain-containing protein [Trebonia sp.]|jgi:hypothetical protein
MRVSDAERDVAAAELREHFASGRLNQDELDERLTATFAAKTRGDLDALFTDLPSSGRVLAGVGAPGSQDDHEHGRGASAGGTFGRMVTASIMLWVLLFLGVVGVFGLGTGRPLGVILLVAAFALLRRLVFIFIGRRRSGGGPRRRGPRRRR